MELVEFLLQRIAEDEAVVTAILRRAPHWSVDHEPWAQGVGVVDSCRESIAVAVGDYAAFHIARWDPARVLAECEAKRRIVKEHRTIRAAYPGTTIETDPCCATCSAGGEYPGEFPCPTLRLLALPYADHPSYDPAWRA